MKKNNIRRRRDIKLFPPSAGFNILFLWNVIISFTGEYIFIRKKTKINFSIFFKKVESVCRCYLRSRNVYSIDWNSPQARAHTCHAFPFSSKFIFFFFSFFKFRASVENNNDNNWFIWLTWKKKKKKSLNALLFFFIF